MSEFNKVLIVYFDYDSTIVYKWINGKIYSKVFRKNTQAKSYFQECSWVDFESIRHYFYFTTKQEKDIKWLKLRGLDN